jgi:hypothetical protein
LFRILEAGERPLWANATRRLDAGEATQFIRGMLEGNPIQKQTLVLMFLEKRWYFFFLDKFGSKRIGARQQ